MKVCESCTKLHIGAYWEWFCRGCLRWPCGCVVQDGTYDWPAKLNAERVWQQKHGPKAA